MKPLIQLLRNAWVRAAIGISLCALIIWFGGPYLGLGDYQPLTGARARALLIAAIALFWLGLLGMHRWWSAERNRRMQDALSAPHNSASSEINARVQAEHVALRARFIEAMTLLRKRNDGSGHLDRLPWYVLIGAPGSGKSTLLEHSGLNFPLLGGAGKHSVSGIGGTRQCDWWFTDRAVFLDTAGRYTTQDSDPAGDAAAWDGFLQLLRRYRRRRPVNGVILSISVAELLTMDERQRQQHAQILRERLDELAARLGVAVPVYLVMTKCDLVAGFMEYFDALDPAGRTQVWGTTFEPSSSVEGIAPTQAGEALDDLLERIDARVVERMHADRDVRRRARILSFPQQLRHLRDLIVPLTHSVFCHHAYGHPPVLRGIYLTSGTQEGTPIDRVLSALGRSFGMHASVAATSRTPRRTYFVERLLNEVVLPEAGFAGTDTRLLRRRRFIEAAAMAAIALITTGLLAGMAISATRNRSHVARVERSLAEYPDDAHAAPPASLRQYYAQALKRLDVLASTTRVAQEVRNHTPLSMRFGLFQGNALVDEINAAYSREVSASVVPGLALQFREGMRNEAADPQRLYNVLKGYLMLGEPAHRDGDQLGLLASEQWREVFPQEDGLVDALQAHFHILFEGRDNLRALPVDATLVDAARASLRAADLATLVYGGLKLASENHREAPVRLDRTLGLLGSVFRRRSGAPLSKPLPALFTRPVFAEMVRNAPARAGLRVDGSIASAVDRFVKDDWVIGATATDPVSRAALAAQVQSLYVADYIRAWDALIGDLQLQPVANMRDASDVAARLAGPGSPLKALLLLVRDNTTDLLRQPVTDPEDRVAAVAKRRVLDRAKSRSEIARVIAEGATPAERGSAQSADAPIVEHFATLNQLTDGTAGAMPLDRVLGVLEQMSKTLLTLRPGTDTIGQTDPALALARQQAEQLPPPLSRWLGGLVGSSQSLVSKGADSALATGFREAAGNDCTRFVHGRYPFTGDSRSDIPLQNFAELFGTGGRFDNFFKQTLSHAVDVSGATWRFRDAEGARAGGAMLAQAQLADDIRQAYFRDGPNPQVGFTVSVTTPPPGISRLVIEMGGQTFEYKAGEPARPVAMQWPGPTSGAARVSAWDDHGRPLPVLDYPGDWGWFHALDAASLQRRTETRFGASFSFGAVHAGIDIEAASLRNPFGDSSVRRFRCPL